MNPIYIQELLQGNNAQPQQMQPQNNAAGAQMPEMQMPQMTQPQFHVTKNPIADGVASAIDSARLSITMREDQKQAAFSKALAAMAAASANQNINRTKKESNLENILRYFGQIVPTGIQNYQTSEENAQNENYGLLKYIQEQEALRQKALELQIEKDSLRQHRKEEREERKRHNLASEEDRRLSRAMMGLQSNFQQRQMQKDIEAAEERAKRREILSQGYLPVEDADKDYIKRVGSAYASIPSYQKVEKDSKRIKQLVEKWEKRDDPIGNSFLQLLEEKDGGGNGWLSSATKALGIGSKKIANQEKLADLQVLEKLASSLRLSYLGQMAKEAGAKSTSNMLKLAIRDASPNPASTDEALVTVADDWINDARLKQNLAREQMNALKKGYVYEHPEVSHREEEEIPSSNTKEQDPFSAYEIKLK